MDNCKNCKYFRKNTDKYYKNYGECDCIKFVYDGFGNDPDYNVTDQLIYSDYEGYRAYFNVGQDFGCIHFEEKREEYFNNGIIEEQNTGDHIPRID